MAEQPQFVTRWRSGTHGAELGVDVAGGIWQFLEGCQNPRWIMVHDDEIERQARVSLVASLNGGVGLIAAERARQVDQEDWTPEHDDEHDCGQMAKAAACYALLAAIGYAHGHATRLIDELWPWEREWWKPKPDNVRNLARAGALIAAEIDRLQRAETTDDAPASGGCEGEI